MTPQRKGFNRESWAEIETILRTIVDNTPQNYFVITGPILTDSLDTIDKSIVIYLRIWYLPLFQQR